MQVPFWFENINRFIGYGCDKPRIVFIGLEEGGAAEPELQIPKRVWWPQRLSALGAVNRLRAPIEPLDNLQKNQTWNRISDILKEAFKINGNAYFPNFGMCDEAFNDANHRHLLAELLPLPKPGFSSWPEFYEQSFRMVTRRGIKQIKSSSSFRTEYFRPHNEDFQPRWWQGDAHIQGRRAMLRETCTSRNVKIIICYGISEPLFRDRLFNDVDFTQIGIQRIWEGKLKKPKIPVFIIPHPTRPKMGETKTIRTHLAKEIRAALGLQA